MPKVHYSYALEQLSNHLSATGLTRSDLERYAAEIVDQSLPIGEKQAKAEIRRRIGKRFKLPRERTKRGALVSVGSEFYSQRSAKKSERGAELDSESTGERIDTILSQQALRQELGHNTLATAGFKQDRDLAELELAINGPLREAARHFGEDPATLLRTRKKLEVWANQPSPTVAPPVIPIPEKCEHGVYLANKTKALYCSACNPHPLRVTRVGLGKPPRKDRRSIEQLPLPKRMRVLSPVLGWGYLLRKREDVVDVEFKKDGKRRIMKVSAVWLDRYARLAQGLFSWLMFDRAQRVIDMQLARDVLGGAAAAGKRVKHS
jgi:hypothetical protein